MVRVLILPAALLAAPAIAAPVSVQIVDAGGAPVVGAIATITVPGTPAPAPGGSYAVAQRNIAFEPHVLIVPVGATVGFPNFDKVRHHVYSFSRTKRFDLKLYGRDETRSVVFDRPGAVAIGCNIHDQMSALIFVTATPFAAASDAAGRVRLAPPAAARAVLTIWSPSIRAAGNQVTSTVAIPAAGLSTTITLPR